MKRLRLADLPLIVKIGFAPMLALVMLVVTAGIAVMAQRQTMEDLQNAVNVGMAQSIQIQKISERITEAHGRLYVLLTHQAGNIEQAKLEGQTKTLVADLKQISADIGKLSQNAPAGQKAKFAKLRKQVDETASAADLVGSMMTADFSAAASFIAPFEQSYMQMVATLSDVVNTTEAATYASARQSEVQATHIQLLLGLEAIITFLIVLGVAAFGAIATRKDILKLAEATEKLAGGDNSIHLSHLERKDELGAIVRSLTVFRDNQLRIIQMRKENEEAQAARAKEVAHVISSLGEGMDHLAACDFSYRLRNDFPEEYQTLCIAFNESMGELENTLKVITSVTAQIQAETSGGSASAAAKGASLKETGEALVHALDAFRENAAAAERRRQQRHEEDAARAKEQATVVESLADGLNSLSAGDLTYKIAASFPQEYVRLRDDFNAALVKLESTLRKVQETTSVIRSGSGDVNSAVDELSHRTEHQAATLEETAASLNEITATVKSTAEGASNASVAIAKAKKDALDSGQIVKDTVEAMHEIKTSADQISQIVGAIDEITFQTNLLSLNASVEAARAGDAGKGFAVVATEVRELSHRTASMAKEIKKLITASEQRVRQGVDLVEQTGGTIERIVAQIIDINDAVNQIANSAKEQSNGLEQINTAVTDMDTVTQQNAAMVQETTNASLSLAGQAEELSSLIARFKMHGAGQADKPANAEGIAPAEDKPVKLSVVPKAAPKPAVKAASGNGYSNGHDTSYATNGHNGFKQNGSKPNGVKNPVPPDVNAIHTPQETAHAILQRIEAKRRGESITPPAEETEDNNWEEF